MNCVVEYQKWKIAHQRPGFGSSELVFVYSRNSTLFSFCILLLETSISELFANLQKEKSKLSKLCMMLWDNIPAVF